MKEVFIEAVCVDYKERALYSVLIPKSEITRIQKHGGLKNTPPPINITKHVEGMLGEEESNVNMDDIWLSLALNKTLYPDA